MFLSKPAIIIAGLAVATALGGTYLAGYRSASNACEADHYRALSERQSAAIAQQERQIAAINQAARRDAERARENARALAEMQEMIDGIEDSDRVCFDRDDLGRLRAIR